IIVSHTTRDLVDSNLPSDVDLRDLGDHRLKDFDEPERVFQVVTTDLPTDFPPLRSANVKTNLPTLGSEFVGREAEVTRVADLVANNRLVTLTGVGGSGKTRLAVHVAGTLVQRFAGGVFFVGLDAIDDPVGFDQLVAEAIEGPAGTSVDETLQQMGPVLLILDNFEHLLGAAPRVSELLHAAPELSVLVTSQALLRLRGEQALPVPALGLPADSTVEAVSESDSGALFIRRLWSTDPSFELTVANAPAIRDIVRRLDGLPLAIELAAARTRLFGLDGLRAELAERLASLGGGFADAPERHRTLAAAIDWSYQLLESDEQQVLRRASVFTDGFSPVAAEQVCGAGALNSLAGLLDKSLITSNIEGGNARFDLLETIKAFGLDQLEQLGELDDTKQHHADYFTSLAIESRDPIRSRSSYAAIERLSIERANLASALRWAAGHDPDSGLHAIGALGRFYEVTGGLNEGRELGEALVAAGGSPSARIDGLLGLAHVVYWLVDYNRAEQLYGEAVALAEQLHDPARLGDAAIGLAYTYLWQERRSEATPLMVRAREAYEEAGDDKGVRLVMTALATAAWHEGDVPTATQIFAEVHELVRSAGDVAEEISMELALGASLIIFGLVDEATSNMLHSLSLISGAGDDSRTTMCLGYLSLGVVRLDPEAGVKLGGAADAIAERQGGSFDLSMLGLGRVAELAADALDPRTIEHLADQGSKLELAEAVAFAFEWAREASLESQPVDIPRVMEIALAHQRQ
ncbi:MAG: hypothetical protein KJO36_00195, partial [Acidimicrobiia bacterium]|nr:hypothetical protein [Acidimicrobiia bacterium]